MIKAISSTGYEYYECSKCNEQVDQFDDICQVCGNVLIKTNFNDYTTKFKALSFIEVLMGEEQEEITIATLENQEIGIKKFAVLNNSQISMRVKYFVINNNHNYLEDGLEQKQLIKIEEFTPQDITLDNKIENVLIHKSLMPEKLQVPSSKFKQFNFDINNNFSNRIDNNVFEYKINWLDEIFPNKNYRNELLNSLSSIRPEMLFYYIYYLIAKYDYSNNNIEITNPFNLIKQYKEASLKILKEKCNIISENESIYSESNISFNWEIHHANFSNEFKDLKDSILDYVNYNKSLQKIIGLENDENPYFSVKSKYFFQDIMYIGYLMSLHRLENEIYSDSYFGVEIINFNNQIDCIIYLTPKGFINISDITKEKRNTIFNDFYKEKGIQFIKSNKLNELLMSTEIFTLNSNLYCHYKIPEENINDFMIKRLNRNHISSTMIEGQTNYKKIN